MANNINNSAPKQWPLTQNKTLTSFEAWRSNFVYRLNSEARFALFLAFMATFVAYFLI